MPSTVVTDLIANDKSTAVLSKVEAGITQYANTAKVKLQSVSQGFESVQQSVGKFSGGMSGAVRGAVSLTTAISALGITGVSGRALSAINALVTGLQALTSAQVLAQAFSGPAGWGTLAIGAAAAAGALALLSTAFSDVRGSADSAAAAADKGPWGRSGGGVSAASSAAKIKSNVGEEVAKLREFEKAYRRAAEEIERFRMVGAKPSAEVVGKLNEAIKGRFGVDLETFAERYRDAIKPLKDLLDSEVISAEQFSRSVRGVQDSLGMGFGPMEQYRRSLLSIAESYRQGQLTAEAFGEKLRQLADSQFGPLLTEGLQQKLDRQLGDIEKAFQSRFGRNLTPEQAERERAARRRAAVQDVTGLGKTPQEQWRAAMERAAVAAKGGDAEGAGKIRRKAWEDWSQGVMQSARERQGLTGPFAGLMTDAEKLKGELAAIRDAYQRGRFGTPGSVGAMDLARRSIAAVVPKTPDVKPQWEGLQDTWKRIQASAAGKGTSPEERAARAAEANIKEVQKSNVLLQKWLDKKDDNRARFG